MKKILIPVLGLLLITGCRPDEFGDLQPAQNNIDAISGTWKLISVVQKDEGAEIKNSPFVTIDLTSIFPYNSSSLVLNTSGGQPSTYTYNRGTAPAIITSASGSWKVDDITNPKVISFINGSDTTKMSVGSYPRSFDNTFSLKNTKVDLGNSNKLAISYTYRFSK